MVSFVKRLGSVTIWVVSVTTPREDEYELEEILQSEYQYNAFFYRVKMQGTFGVTEQMAAENLSRLRRTWSASSSYRTPSSLSFKSLGTRSRFGIGRRSANAATTTTVAKIYVIAAGSPPLGYA